MCEGRRGCALHFRAVGILVDGGGDDGDAAFDDVSDGDAPLPPWLESAAREGHGAPKGAIVEGGAADAPWRRHPVEADDDDVPSPGSTPSANRCSRNMNCLSPAAPFTKLRRVRAWSRTPRRVDPHDAARQNLGVVEGGSSGASAGRGHGACAWRIVDRVVGYDERSSPARRLVRRRAVEQIRVREQYVAWPHRSVDQGKSLHRFPQGLFVDARLLTGYAVR